MLRHLFKSKKMRRKEANAKAILPVYGRGATTLPADYLTRHQPSDPATVAKLKAAAQERREQRNARRLANTQRNSATGELARTVSKT